MTDTTNKAIITTYDYQQRVAAPPFSDKQKFGFKKCKKEEGLQAQSGTKTQLLHLNILNQSCFDLQSELDKESKQILLIEKKKMNFATPQRKLIKNVSFPQLLNKSIIGIQSTKLKSDYINSEVSKPTYINEDNKLVDHQNSNKQKFCINFSKQKNQETQAKIMIKKQSQNQDTQQTLKQKMYQIQKIDKKEIAQGHKQIRKKLINFIGSNNKIVLNQSDSPYKKDFPNLQQSLEVQQQEQIYQSKKFLNLSNNKIKQKIQQNLQTQLDKNFNKLQISSNHNNVIGYMNNLEEDKSHIQDQTKKLTSLNKNAVTYQVNQELININRRKASLKLQNLKQITQVQKSNDNFNQTQQITKEYANTPLLKNPDLGDQDFSPFFLHNKISLNNSWTKQKKNNQKEYKTQNQTKLSRSQHKSRTLKQENCFKLKKTNIVRKVQEERALENLQTDWIESRNSLSPIIQKNKFKIQSESSQSQVNSSFINIKISEIKEEPSSTEHQAAYLSSMPQKNKMSFNIKKLNQDFQQEQQNVPIQQDQSQVTRKKGNLKLKIKKNKKMELCANLEVDKNQENDLSSSQNDFSKSLKQTDQMNNQNGFQAKIKRKFRKLDMSGFKKPWLQQIQTPLLDISFDQNDQRENNKINVFKEKGSLQKEIIKQLELKAKQMNERNIKSSSSKYLKKNQDQKQQIKNNEDIYFETSFEYQILKQLNQKFENSQRKKSQFNQLQKQISRSQEFLQQIQVKNNSQKGSNYLSVEQSKNQQNISFCLYQQSQRESSQKSCLRYEEENSYEKFKENFKFCQSDRSFFKIIYESQSIQALA